MISLFAWVKKHKLLIITVAIYVAEWFVYAVWQHMPPSDSRFYVILDSVIMKGLIWVLPAVIGLLIFRKSATPLFKSRFPVLPCLVLVSLSAAFLHTVRWANGLLDTHVIFDPLMLVPAVSAGIIEEISFRGFIFNLQEKDVGVFPAAILNGLMFVMFHYTGILYGEPISQLLSLRVLLLFVMGVIFCLMFKKWKNLWLNIIVHAIWNVLSYLFCLTG